MKVFSICFLAALASFGAQAQISGIIRSGDKPLSGARAFIRNSSISSVTDATGAFDLQGIEPGFSELVIYLKGYQLFKSRIRVVAGKASRLNLKLVATENTNPAGKEQNAGSTFFARLLGDGPYAKKCKVVNPRSVVITGDSSAQVTFKEPLVIENSGSGYKLSCYLPVSDVPSAVVQDQVIVVFDTLVPKAEQQAKEWHTTRENLFFGSRRHFLWALVHREARHQNFELLDAEGREILSDSLDEPSKLPGYKKLVLPAGLKVRYIGGNDNDDVVSWLSAKEPVDVSFTGIPLNEQALEVTGAMKKGLADEIPAEFFPAKRMSELIRAREIVKLLQEKVHIQTDKPYYYPGEVLWCSAYINSAVPEYRDSLSHVLYMELISPEKFVVLTKILRIDSGFAHGDFIFPDSVKPGNYYLRAYTNLMKNFGPEALWTKKIPVINSTYRVDAGQASTGAGKSANLAITADKASYKTREKISLTLKVTDGTGRPARSRLSVAVTDATQVTPIRENFITSEYPFDTLQSIQWPARIRFPMESGVSLDGQFLTDKGKKEKARIEIVKGMEEFVTRSTDDEGHFFQSGYDFYDTTTFRIQAKNEKGKVYGKIELASHQPPPMDFEFSSDSLRLINTQKPQRVISDYEVPPGAKVLAEVSITARRLSYNEFIVKRYGNPGRVISGDQLSGTDLVNSLLATLPGLTINYVPTTDLRQSRVLKLGNSQNKKMYYWEPLIYVNNMNMGGGQNWELNQGGQSAVDVLRQFLPSMIDHIEVISVPNGSIYNEGGVGLIALILKPGYGPKAFDKFKVEGYHKPRDFRAPDYESSETNINLQDLRSTLYWNPEVRTNEAAGEKTLTFFASDLAGPYRVVVEGVTREGVPLRSEKFIQVVDR